MLLLGFPCIGDIGDCCIVVLRFDSFENPGVLVINLFAFDLGGVFQVAPRVGHL